MIGTFHSQEIDPATHLLAACIHSTPLIAAFIQLGAVNLLAAQILDLQHWLIHTIVLQYQAGSSFEAYRIGIDVQGRLLHQITI